MSHVDLEEHTGAYKGHITGYKCPRCGKGQGYLFFSKTGVMYFCGDKTCLQEDSNASKGKVQHIIVGNQQDAAMSFGLGSRYLNASLTKCDKDPGVTQGIHSWLKKMKNMLTIVGPTNTGKTYFCAALGNYLSDQKISVNYVMYRRFFEDIQKAIQKNENQYFIVEKLSDVDVLIIDDVGASTNTEWQKEMFLDLIDRRYNSQKPTIITTNFLEEDCKNHLGERISRRVFSKDNHLVQLGPEYAR